MTEPSDKFILSDSTGLIINGQPVDDGDDDRIVSDDDGDEVTKRADALARRKAVAKALRRKGGKRK